MANSRMINTRFWDDDYTSNLDPVEKLLFLYFLTNTSTNISGIYEIPIKKIALETGLDRDMVLKILDRFTKDGKIFYYKGWVCLKNFVKNQNQNSPKVKIGIEREIMALNKDILNIFIGYGYPMDTLSHLTKLNLTKLNLTDTMYNYEQIDNEGNPIKKKRLSRLNGETNKFLISIGCLWADLMKSKLGQKDEEICLTNIYYPIRACYDREKWNKEEFKNLFLYFLNDSKIKPEDKISFDLCLSQKYVAKYKLAQKLKPKTNASVSSEIKL